MIGLDLLKQRDNLGLLGGAHDVDGTLDFLGTSLGAFLVSHNGIHQTATTGAVGEKLRRRQHTRRHRHPRERTSVQQGAADRDVVDAQLYKPGGQSTINPSSPVTTVQGLGDRRISGMTRVQVTDRPQRRHNGPDH
jgi:hypothetical protein